MSCDLYLAALSTFAGTLGVSDHPAIKAPTTTAGAGATVRVQSDGGTFNLNPTASLAFPGAGGVVAAAQTGSIASTYTTWLSALPTGGAGWQEDWVVRDLAAFTSPPTPMVWSKVSGDLLTEAETKVLQAEAAAAGVQYSLARMQFQYRRAPTATQQAAAPAPTACTVGRSMFELWPLTAGKVAARPTAALLRESMAQVGKVVDHWILGSAYKPPGGTSELCWAPSATPSASLAAFLQRYLPATGAGPLGANGLTGSRYVQIVYELTPFA